MTQESELETFAKDVKGLMAAMLPGFAEIGADMAAQAGVVGQKLYTRENMDMVKRAQVAAPAFGRLLDAVLRLAEDGTLDKVTNVLEAISDVDFENPRKVGVLGAIKEMNDPEVQKALGLVLDIARKVPAAVKR